MMNMTRKLIKFLKKTDSTSTQDPCSFRVDRLEFKYDTNPRGFLCFCILKGSLEYYINLFHLHLNSPFTITPISLDLFQGFNVTVVSQNIGWTFTDYQIKSMANDFQTHQSVR